MKEIVSLKSALKACESKLSPKDLRGVNVRLLIMYHLATIMYNMCVEIEVILNKQNLFRMSIKQEFNKIKSLIKNSVDLSISRKFTDVENEDAIEDYDALEKMVKEYGGIYEEEE